MAAHQVRRWAHGFGAPFAKVRVMGRATRQELWE